MTLQLPSIKSVRNVVEHLRNMNHMLTVSANQSGRLTFRVENPLIKLSAHFPSLCVQSIMEGPLDTGKNADSDEEINSVDDSNREAVSCQIDIRKFLTLLNGMQITSHKTICSIVNEKMVRLHFEQPNVVTFQCFLTSVST